MVHHDWDVQERCHRRFLVKYIIPSAKNLVKTHTLYVVGREAEIAGNLVDFEVDANMAIIMVNAVSLTSGHLIGRNVLTTSTADTSSPRKGLNFVKMSPKKPPMASGSENRPIPTPPVTPRGLQGVENEPNSKRKAVEETDEDAEDNSEGEKSDAMEIECEDTVKGKGTRASARKGILQAAAKRMKRL
ncbi:hypothetical protein PSHT_15657 [Puccinia striiformis]|uniref:Uncharacterized protein n=1 Tax=Puccinia striiformis TaxID=27350 RepID=A0A2S4UDQ8_9BASI|nr:hypothetical protein PSHT_15657 [Puccinia striiformis]